MVLPPPVRINARLELMLLSGSHACRALLRAWPSQGVGQGQQGGFGCLDTGTGPSPHWDPPAGRECSPVVSAVPQELRPCCQGCPTTHGGGSWRQHRIPEWLGWEGP